ENAPFAPAQRAWLNGFLAGLYGGASAAGVSTATPPIADAEDLPWHDPALEPEERMRLAEGRPLPQRLMAAVGQLDCGRGGYLCGSYAEALAEGREAGTSLCIPGANPTARLLKQLRGETPAAVAAPVARTAPRPVGRPVRVLSAEPLTRTGSSKDV